jgi:hypothetical protein
VQYESAICARVFWLSVGQRSLPEGRRRWLEARPANVTAPPVMQALMAGTYLMSGTERPWLSGLFAGGFWVVGGWFLFDLCRKLAGGSLGALVALAFYLLAPLGIIVSRSFQPEALMTFAFLVALWYLVRFDAGRGPRLRPGGPRQVRLLPAPLAGRLPGPGVQGAWGATDVPVAGPLCLRGPPVPAERAVHLALHPCPRRTEDHPRSVALAPLLRRMGGAGERGRRLDRPGRRHRRLRHVDHP